MNVTEELRKALVINQLAETGKWLPVDALGRKVSHEDTKHVELMACAKCGKRFKWNQKSWMQRHEQEHAEEEAKAQLSKREPVPAKGKPEQVESEPSLHDIQEQLWALMEMVERLANTRKRA